MPPPGDARDARDRKRLAKPGKVGIVSKFLTPARHHKDTIETPRGPSSRPPKMTKETKNPPKKNARLGRCKTPLRA